MGLLRSTVPLVAAPDPRRLCDLHVPATVSTFRLCCVREVQAMPLLLHSGCIFVIQAMRHSDNMLPSCQERFWC